MWSMVVRCMVALCLVGAGCASAADGGSGGGQLSTGPANGPIAVFAAASLTDAFSAMEEAFEEQYPGTDIRLNLAGSSTLREQLLEGAPADVLATADEPTMEAVLDAGRIDPTSGPQVFARNELALAVPASGSPVTSLVDLARDELLIGLCAPAVPCGRLARELLAAAEVTAAIDTNEPDVRALLAKIELGELDAGIVYRSDIATSDAVTEVPVEASVVADYPIGLVDDGPNRAGGEAFIAFVRSARGREILASHGFETP